MESTVFTSPITNEDYYDEYDILFNLHLNDMNFPYDTYHYNFFNEIRISIFYIVAVCVGLPCLIWAFYSVHLQRKASGRISAFIILLLLNDLLQLLLYPYTVSEVLFIPLFSSPEHYFILVVSACLKITGFHLQPLVALEAALTMKYPMISTYIFSCCCYIMITIIILLIPVMCALGLFFSGRHFGHMCEYLTFGSFLLPACLLIVTGIIIYKAPPTAASTPVTESRPGAAVFAVSLVTLIVLYLPSVMLLIVLNNFYLSESWLVMTFCLLSLTVISEPLLCVLVCRQNLSAQTKKTRIELNSEQTSV